MYVVITKLVKKFLNFISPPDLLFKYSAEFQKKYLKSFGEPKDLFERSFFQYRCQQRLRNRLVSIFVDMICFPLIIYYLFFKHNNSYSFIEKKDAVFIGDKRIFNVIPGSILSEFDTIECSNFFWNGKYSSDDNKIFYALIKRYPFSFEFIFKCIMKIRMYRWIKDSYMPQAIIAISEYSYTSSILTYWCRQNNIQHINVMHGEKFFFIRDSFFCFDRCYVWDEYYKQLFIKLKAESKQFVIEQPPCLKLHIDYNYKKYDYTYYLNDQNQKQLHSIVNILILLKKQGYLVIIRPHPRYTNLKNLKMISKDNIELQDYNTTTLEESLSLTRAVISLHSTVINQALQNNIKVIIDNISDIEAYNKLRDIEYKYILDNKILRLSDEINRQCQTK